MHVHVFNFYSLLAVLHICSGLLYSSSYCSAVAGRYGSNHEGEDADDDAACFACACITSMPSLRFMPGLATALKTSLDIKNVFGTHVVLIV